MVLKHTHTVHIEGCSSEFHQLSSILFYSIEAQLL